MSTVNKNEPAIILAVTRTLKSLPNGRVRISLDVDEKHSNMAYFLFNKPGDMVAIAYLNPEFDQQEL